MPHRDTSVAIQQAITQALNATQGHKSSCQQVIYIYQSKMMGTISPAGYIKTEFQSALHATQGHKPSYQQALYIYIYPK